MMLPMVEKSMKNAGKHIGCQRQIDALSVASLWLELKDALTENTLRLTKARFTRNAGINIANPQPPSASIAMSHVARLWAGFLGCSTSWEMIRATAMWNALTATQVSEETDRAEDNF
mmetsp:Transcript_33231/g.43792  ORF Transcript_33231/g.43792 Transcript_33231/m.43792 type:complete len:117 (-) Transcript_33231:360-710(-)